jgi:integrase
LQQARRGPTRTSSSRPRSARPSIRTTSPATSIDFYACAGLGHWTPHELRHPAASITLAQGTPLWVGSEVLGHASAITKDVYGHLVGDEKKEATEAITDELFERPKRRKRDHGA